MTPTRPGTYRAKVLNRGVGEVGRDSRLLALTAEYHIVQERVNGEWYEMGPDEQNWTISGTHFIEKKDGTMNEFTIKKLMAAFGWNGVDVFALDDAPLPDDHLVRLELDWETYKDKKQMRVKWIDAADSEAGGGIVRASASERSAIEARVGGKLRALFGGTQPPVPAKPAGSPTRPAPAPAPAKPAATAPVPATTTAEYNGPQNVNDLWAWFVATHVPTIAQTDQERAWFKALRDVFGDRERYDSLTPVECERFVAEAGKYVLPF